MVFVFFCVGGVLPPMRRHPSLATRDGAPQATRTLETDALLLARTLESYSGAVIVIANDWPFYYDLEELRSSREFGRRIVNVVRTLGSTKESAVLDFMSGRAEPFIVIASPDFEFTYLTETRRIDVGIEQGFDEEAQVSLLEHLRLLGEQATNPLTEDDMLRATVGSRDLKRARKYISPIRAGDDVAFQRKLRYLVSEEAMR
ncbi:hypothetical protein [Burkholderia sp. 9120]|uniref:hypothetical protein n=1 Tax=Burkholderia sp. 9120 TaxID=1500897 RepID=UPI0012E0A846|nr:hypothetical protein [Burkholderia sp. 9120]